MVMFIYLVVNKLKFCLATTLWDYMWVVKEKQIQRAIIPYAYLICAICERKGVQITCTPGLAYEEAIGLKTVSRLKAKFEKQEKDSEEEKAEFSSEGMSMLMAQVVKINENLEIQQERMEMMEGVLASALENRGPQEVIDTTVLRIALNHLGDQVQELNEKKEPQGVNEELVVVMKNLMSNLEVKDKEVGTEKEIGMMIQAVHTDVANCATAIRALDTTTAELSQTVATEHARLSVGGQRASDAIQEKLELVVEKMEFLKKLCQLISSSQEEIDLVLNDLKGEVYQQGRRIKKIYKKVNPAVPEREEVQNVEDEGAVGEEGV